MDDTSRAAKARYYELLRQQPPMERLRTAVLLIRSVRQLAEADIRRADPNASPREVKRALASRLYGIDVAERLFSEAMD